MRKVPEPTEAQARAYYDAHKDLFVEPEKLRLSVILLKVDPSAPKAAWDKARDEAAAHAQAHRRRRGFRRRSRGGTRAIRRRRMAATWATCIAACCRTVSTRWSTS